MEFMQDFWHIKILHIWSKFIGGFSILVASMFLIGLITDLGDHAPLGGDFNPLDGLYDLGNIVELETRQRGIVNLRFLE